MSSPAPINRRVLLLPLGLFFKSCWTVEIVSEMDVLVSRSESFAKWTYHHISGLSLIKHKSGFDVAQFRESSTI